jgi:phage-related protein
VIYLARREEAVYVLHAFQKRSRAPPRANLELARERYAALPPKLKKARK